MHAYMTPAEKPRLTPITTERLLLVEGTDDERFFIPLLRWIGINDIQVQRYFGDEWLNVIKVIPKQSGFNGVTSIGVVRDADEDAGAAFESVCAGLRQAGLPTPQAPLHPTNGSPKVAVAIIPPHAKRGALEEMCLQSVAGYLSLQCVEEYIVCLRARSVSLPSALGKVRLHAFLSAKPNPDAKLGEAASFGYWPFESPAFAQIVQFLKDL